MNERNGEPPCPCLLDVVSTEPGSLLADVIEDYEAQVQPVDGSWYRPLFGTVAGFYRRSPVDRHPAGFRTEEAALRG